MLGAVLIVQGAGATDASRIHAATAALRAVCDRVVVFGPGESAEDDSLPLPADASELAAVAAALRAAGEGHVAVLAGDLMHPSAELLRYMNQVRGNFEAVVPEGRDGRLQPVFAIYRTTLLRRAQGLIAAGDRDLSKLLDLATVRRITADEVAKFGEPERLLERPGPAPF